MPIAFEPLSRRHFPLLLEWLQMPHVRAWWDGDIEWTPEKIDSKYAAYVDRSGIPDVYGHVILKDAAPLGCIQYYPLEDRPDAAGVDLYIGASDHLAKGLGPDVLSTFISHIILPEFSSIWVDPHRENYHAIRAFRKAGFIEVETRGDFLWMRLQR